MARKSYGQTKSLCFKVTLRGDEKELFDKYLLQHIMKTGELYMQPTTLTRRIIVEYMQQNLDKAFFIEFAKAKENLKKLKEDKLPQIDH